MDTIIWLGSCEETKSQHSAMICPGSNHKEAVERIQTQICVPSVHVLSPAPRPPRLPYTRGYSCKPHMSFLEVHSLMEKKTQQLTVIQLSM